MNLGRQFHRFDRLLLVEQLFDLVCLLLGRDGVLGLFAVALAAKEIGAGSAVEAGADAAKPLFFVLGCFHSV